MIGTGGIVNAFAEEQDGKQKLSMQEVVGLSNLVFWGPRSVFFFPKKNYLFEHT